MDSLSSKAKRVPFIHFQKRVFEGSLVKLIAFAGILAVAGAASAQTELVANGNFTANAASFNTWPGTLGGDNPSDIPNWNTYPDNDGKGLNGAITGVGNIFGPANPGGFTFVFAQHTENGIYQYIPLDPNTTYTVEIDVAARNGYDAALFSVKFANSGEAPFWESDSLNGGNPSDASQAAFVHWKVDFTTPLVVNGPTIQLWNKSVAEGDRTVCFANVSVKKKVAEVLSITPPPNVTVVVNSGTSIATNVAIFTPVTTGSTSVSSDAPSQFTLGDTPVIWTATDAGANEATATQTVTVVSPPNFSGTILSNQLPQLTLTRGAAEATRFEASNNLLTQTSWTTLTTIPRTNVTVQWVDFAATNIPARFYRPVELTALDTYATTNHPPEYSYTLLSTTPGTGQTTYILEMTSQSWFTTTEVDRPLWKHWMIIVKPDTVSHSTALLHISAGNNGGTAPTSAEAITRQIAINTQSVVAELRMVPNQPLTFPGESFTRVEDAIMAYAWDKYLDHGDEMWVPRLPMTKAAVLAMDTVTAVCASEAATTVDKFVVTGASKRGWTTWMTAIVDNRVQAIIPVVIDILNLTPNLKHHWKCYGYWAPAIGDYEAAGILDRLDTPEWDAMMAIDDPYAYRNRLSLPKFLINASSDEFFLPDSSQYYFDDLPGVKYIRYVPNGRHSLNPWSYVESCHYAVLNSSTLPEFTWTQPTENSIRVETDTTPTSVKLWQAFNNTREFRGDLPGGAPTWFSTTLTDQGGGVYVGTVATPGSGYRGFFVEMTYPSPGGSAPPYQFTTHIKVVPDTYPYAWPPN